MDYCLKEIISVVGIIITASITIWQYKQVRFAETVIGARKEYLQKFRDYSCQFCISTERLMKAANDNNEEKRSQLDSAYKLRLMLNPFDYVGCWDGEIIKLINCLIQHPNEKELKRLTALLQASCILEWRGITKEGIKGILKNKSKEHLRDETYDRYVTYCKNRNLYE